MATCTYQFNVGIQSEIGMLSIPYFKVDKAMPINQEDVLDVMGSPTHLPTFNNLECSGLLYRVKEPEKEIYSVLPNSGDSFEFIPGIAKMFYTNTNSMILQSMSGSGNYLDLNVSTLVTGGYDYESVFMYLFESSDHYFRLGSSVSLDHVGVAYPERMKPGYFVQSGTPSGTVYHHMGYISSQPPYSSSNFVTILTNYFTQNPPTPAPVQSTDPYAGGGTSETGGGTGDFDNTSDPVDFPALPALGAVDSGFITLFNPTLTELKNLATYMWTNPLFDISAWKKVLADPMDAIIGLSIIPVPVPESGTASIKVGNLLTDVSAHVASAQFIEIQCGSINVNEFWGSYLDYDPYTKAEIYLPYCGTHQLSVDEIMGKTIEVRYHVDILSGACCAYVKCGESVLYSFIGQCASSVPISGSDFTNVINGVLSAATAIGSLVATGGASAPLAVPQLAATSANALKPNVEKSGALSGTGGILGIQKPYLILSRPRQALPDYQNTYTGYPSYITSTLGDLSGYTEIEEIHLHDIPATGDEISEIENLLKTGVIL